MYPKESLDCLDTMKVRNDQPQDFDGMGAWASNQFDAPGTDAKIRNFKFTTQQVLVAIPCFNISKNYINFSWKNILIFEQMTSNKVTDNTSAEIFQSLHDFYDLFLFGGNLC